MSMRTIVAENIRRLLGKTHNFNAVFGSPVGQIVLVDILKECGSDIQSFVAGEPDTTAFNEGKRRIGNYIMNIMNMESKDAKRISELISGPEGSEEGEYRE